MGAFCVFGISKSVCRKRAERTTPTFVTDGNKRRELPAAEWGGLVMIEAERLFLAGANPVRISPEFDAPQFCRDWISASPGEVADTRLMYRGQKIDKDGAAVVRLGVPVMTWLVFDESKTWPRPFEEAA